MVRIRNAISLKLLATPPGFEPGTFSLEGYEETLYYQTPVILFRSENWPIAQPKYHRTPSQLWTADRTRGDSWRASDFSTFRRGPQPRLPPPVPLPSSRTGGQTNVLWPVPVCQGGSALRGTKRGAIPATILRASLVSSAIATVALGHLPIASSAAVVSAPRARLIPIQAKACRCTKIAEDPINLRRNSSNLSQVNSSVSS
jgi:hypothetical protein